MNHLIKHFSANRLIIILAVLLISVLPSRATDLPGEDIEASAGSYDMVQKAAYSNNAEEPSGGSYGKGIIAYQIESFYNNWMTPTTQIISAGGGTPLTLQNNSLKLKSTDSYSFELLDPNKVMGGSKFFMLNRTADRITDLSNFSVTLQNNSVDTNKADISALKGDVAGALIDLQNVFSTGTGLGTLTVSTNTVTIDTSSTSEDTKIYGGKILFTTDAATPNTGVVSINHQILFNAVTVDDGVHSNNIIGGELALISTTEGTQNIQLNGDIDSNTVTLKKGTFSNAIIAGGNTYLDGITAKTGSTVNSNITNNTVTITGGTFNNTMIVGGLSAFKDSTNVPLAGNITGNVIDISGDVVINDATSLLYGAFSNSSSTTINTNSLNLGTKGIVVYGVANFDTYNFDITSANKNDIYLTSTNGNGYGSSLLQDLTGDDSLQNGKWDISGATVSWDNTDPTKRPANLNLGDSVSLLKSNQGFNGTIANDGATPTVTDGTATYTYALHQREKSIDLVHTDLAVAGDWAQNVIMSGGQYAGDNVTMNVTGKLSSANISVTSNNVATAALTASTLDLTANSSSMALNSTQSNWTRTPDKIATFNIIDIGDGQSLTKTGNAFYTFTTLNATGNVQVNSLDVMGNTATANLGSGVSANFDAINLVNGANLTLNTSGGGTYVFNSLNTYGTGNTFSGDLNAANKALNFYLADTTATGATALNVTGNADITDSTVRVGITGSSSALQLDDTVTLLNAGTLTGAPVSLTGVGMQGLMVKYQFDVATSGNQLVATVTNTQLSDNAKAFSEGRAASAALLIQGADFAAQDGMAAAQVAAENTNGLATFGVLGGGKSRYETGSHVDLTAFNAAVGLSHIVPAKFDADWLLSSFIEYGTGNYHSHNTFFSGDVVGDGKDSYIGLGILGKRTSYQNNYVEISARAGQAKSDFEGYVYGVYDNATYDYKTMYYGTHFGLGHIWQWSKKSSFDLFGKYFWTHEDGKNAHVSSGDIISFGHTNSSRVRAGGKLNYEFNSKWQGYLGLSYDYEMHGKMRATTYGMDIDAPSLNGATGIGEIGLTYTKNAISIGFGGTGYLGKHRGGSGHVKLGYSF